MRQRTVFGEKQIPKHISSFTYPPGSLKPLGGLNKILIPTLLLIVILSVIRALTLPGAWDGVAYLFRPQWSQLNDPKLWLSALTQNAWDTGAGWGLFLTYAAYMKSEHGTVKNAFITGIGNNTVSLLAVIISSLIAQLELPTRVLVDTGMKRSKAIGIIIAVVYLLGIPSARNLNILSNQDYVWGIALMISGAFVAFAVIKQGISKIRVEISLTENDWALGSWWDIIIRLFIPFAAIILLVWWLFQSATVFAPDQWYNPFNPFSVMTCLAQWFVMTGIFILYNRRIANSMIG